MIAVDTNVLLYAHREELPQHAAALTAVQGLIESGRSWAIPWPCVHELWGLATNKRVFPDAMPPERGADLLREILALPGLVTLAETRRHADILLDLAETSPIMGGRVHDAKIAAICLGHGIDELWTADRDFSSFPALRTRNPLVSNN